MEMEHYAHVPLREKDAGTKLDAPYTTTAPHVHTKVLGRGTFAQNAEMKSTPVSARI
jgi:hypothetical protein